MSLDPPTARKPAADRPGGPTYALRSAFALLPGWAVAAARLPAIRPLSDTLRPYVVDLLAAAAGLLGAVGTGQSLFAPDATGDAPWLHALFLACTAVMLLGAVRFMVRTMDFPEPAEHGAEDATVSPATARGRRHEAGGAKE